MTRKTTTPNKVLSFYEVTCCHGLERFVQRELRRQFSKNHRLSDGREPGEVLFTLSSEWKPLLTLKTAHDVFRVLPFEVARPRGVLEPRLLLEMGKAVAAIQKAHGKSPLRSFRVSAAGTESKDLKRFRELFALQTKLVEDNENGEMLVRLRRSKILKNGWDVLLRMTARPLHVRAWRKVDYRGALDATIARAMLEMLETQNGETLLDPMCGSGTFLAEQLGLKNIGALVGIEREQKALKSAIKNTATANAKAVTLFQGDATTLPFATGSVDKIAVNPPWGEAIRAEKLDTLYHSLLVESARVLKPGGRLCLIVERAEELQKAHHPLEKTLKPCEMHRVLQRKGFHPTIFLFERTAKRP